MPVRLFIGIFVMFSLSFASASVELSLEELRERFEAAVKAEEGEYVEKAGKLAEGYLGGLQRLKTTLGKEEKLEQATHVLGEIEMVKIGEDPRKLPESADYRLKSLRSKWERLRAEALEGKKDAIAKLAETYFKLLEERKRALTRSGKIREALVVEKERERVGRLEVVMWSLRGDDVDASLRGSYGVGNLALAEQGTEASAPKRPEFMNDGLVDNVTDRDGWAWGIVPCEFLLELPKLYVVSRVRLLLWDRDTRIYSWRVEVSADGKTWSVVDDEERDPKSDGWKEIKFPPQDVRFVRVSSYGEIKNKGFAVVEIEVYSPEQ